MTITPNSRASGKPSRHACFQVLFMILLLDGPSMSQKPINAGKGSRSETILQRQLQLPHGLRAGDDAECGRTLVVSGRRVVISPIEGVESLEAHVQFVALPDLDIP